MMDKTADKPNDVVMPTRVVLITSAIYAGLLMLSEFCLVLWHLKFGTPLTVEQITVMALITSAVALPAVGFFVYKSEDALANLRRLEQISQVDTLTGLLNRRSFDERLESQIIVAGSQECAGTLLFIDVDHFKGLNEDLGYALGDRVLTTIAATLTATAQPDDVIGRLGGDRFGVFLPRTDIEGGLKVAERLQRAIAQNCHALDLGDKELSVSIGVADHRPGAAPRDCVRLADMQLQAAKTSGRDRICAYRLRTVA